MLHHAILVFILAALFFGPRRGGGRPSNVTIILGTFFILYMLMMFGMGALWNALFQPTPRP